jgi:hypothetical protein
MEKTMDDTLTAAPTAAASMSYRGTGRGKIGNKLVIITPNTLKGTNLVVPVTKESHQVSWCEQICSEIIPLSRESYTTDSYMMNQMKYTAPANCHHHFDGIIKKNNHLHNFYSTPVLTAMTNNALEQQLSLQQHYDYDNDDNRDGNSNDMNQVLYQPGNDNISNCFLDIEKFPYDNDFDDDMDDDDMVQTPDHTIHYHHGNKSDHYDRSNTNPYQWDQIHTSTTPIITATTYNELEQQLYQPRNIAVNHKTAEGMEDGSGNMNLVLYQLPKIDDDDSSCFIDSEKDVDSDDDNNGDEMVQTPDHTMHYCYHRHSM